jgi:hypothetical protein
MTRNLSGWDVTVGGLLLAGAGAYAMWTGWDMILLERGWSMFIAGAVAISGGVVTMALGRVVAHLARIAPATAHLTPLPAVAASPAPVAIAEPSENGREEAPPEQAVAEEKAAVTAAAKAAPSKPPLVKPSPSKLPLPSQPLAKPPSSRPPLSKPLAKLVETQIAARDDDKPAKAEGAPLRPASPPPRFVVPPSGAAQPDERAVGSKSETQPPDFAALLNPQQHAEPKAEPATPPSEVDRYTAGDATYVMMSDGSVEVHSAEGVQRYPSLAALKADTTLRQR